MRLLLSACVLALAFSAAEAAQTCRTVWNGGTQTKVCTRIGSDPNLGYYTPETAKKNAPWNAAHGIYPDSWAGRQMQPHYQGSHRPTGVSPSSGRSVQGGSVDRL
jgi:hypothetical protein